MIFRTESLSAGAVDARAATIVKTAAKMMVAAFAGLFGRTNRRTADILTLSNHELRDIGLEHGVPGHCTPGAPIAYDLLDLIPRSSPFSHRIPR
jgi:hypothetical protein